MIYVKFLTGGLSSNIHFRFIIGIYLQNYFRNSNRGENAIDSFSYEIYIKNPNSVILKIFCRNLIIILLEVNLHPYIFRYLLLEKNVSFYGNIVDK